MHSLQSYVAVSQITDRHVAATSARAARRASKQRSAATATAFAGNAVLRRAVAQDSVAIARLAELDGAANPTGEMVVAEVDDQIVAAVPLRGGRAIADPFRPTAGLVALLRDRARLLTGAGTRNRRTLRPRPRLRTA